MPVEGKFLTFTELEVETKTKLFAISGRGTKIHLGHVKFRPQWRCYVFVPDNGTLFDYKCLTDLTDFIERQNQEWRAGLKL